MSDVNSNFLSTCRTTEGPAVLLCFQLFISYPSSLFHFVWQLPLKKRLAFPPRLQALMCDYFDTVSFNLKYPSPTQPPSVSSLPPTFSPSFPSNSSRQTGAQSAGYSIYCWTHCCSSVSSQPPRFSLGSSALPRGPRKMKRAEGGSNLIHRLCWDCFRSEVPPHRSMLRPGQRGPHCSYSRLRGATP